MTEIRRIEISSVKPSEKESAVKRKVKTIRLVLSLGESNATSCPEYSYTDLINAEKGRLGIGKDSLNPFGEDEDDFREVAAIAQRFEAKYGTKSFKTGKKRQTQDMDDYYDVGDGYDEDDPFIDNTEAYDEVVPSTLTTKYGGFYINQGKLDFKSISDDSNDTFVDDKIKKKPKRKIIESDSDEEETPEAIAKKFKAMKRKKLLEGREAEKKKKKLGSNVNGEISIKKKKKKNLLKMKQSSSIESLVPEENVTSTPKTLSSTTSTSVKTTNSTVITTCTTVTSTTNPTAVTASATVTTPAVDSSVNGTPLSKDKSSVLDDVIMKESSIVSDVQATKEESSSRSGDEDKKSESQSEEKNTQLPSPLPPKLAEDITKLKQLAKMRTEGKTKFFSGTTNELLLKIENESLKLSKGQRSAIFNHLGEHLPSGKNALLRRAKKLRQPKDQLKEPMEKLQEAIKSEMPKAIENHQMAIARAKLEAKPNGAEAPTEDAATESDDEEAKADTKKTRLPRKKFDWTPEITELVLKVVQVKMGMYNTLKIKPQPADEYMKAFLDSEIKPLWPQLWMNTRALLKLIREAKGGKPKKNISGKTSPVPMSEPSPSQHVSKMDSVVEISSIMEDQAEKKKVTNSDSVIEITSISDDVDEKKNVVVNLPDTDAKSTLSIGNVQTPTSSPYGGASSLYPNMQSGQIIKSEPKIIPSKPGGVSTISHLHSAAKANEKTGLGNRVPSPIVIKDSPESTPVKMGTIISNPIPKATSTPVLTGSSGVSSTLNNRSLIQGLEHPPTHRKEGALPSKPQVSLSSPQQQQQSQKVGGISNNVFQQQQKKLQASQSKQTTQLKAGSNQQPQKKVFPQESKISLINQKITAVSGVAKDHPVATVSRIPASSTAPYKQTAAPISAAKTTPLLVQPKSSPINQRQPQTNSSFTSSAQNLNLSANKKKQLCMLNPNQAQAGSTPTMSPPNPQTKKQTGMNNSPITTLSNSGDHQKQFPPKQSPLTNSNPLLLLNKPNSASVPSGSQVKSGIVLGTSLPKFKPQTTTDRSTNPTSVKPLTVQTSMFSSSSYSPSSILSLSRTSTPSPQKSPGSPGSTASTLFDRIQSQILNQEATQEQGLKVLAMAMNIEGSAIPKLGQGTNRDSSPSGNFK